MRSLLLVVAAARALTFEGVKNARRLAGAAANLPVWRTATLDNATAADVAALRNVARVIDLRNDHLTATLDAALEDFDRIIVPWGALHLPHVEDHILAAGFEPIAASYRPLLSWRTVARELFG